MTLILRTMRNQIDVLVPSGSNVPAPERPDLVLTIKAPVAASLQASRPLSLSGLGSAAAFG